MHTESSLVAVQFDSLEQQNESAILGMWSFLLTEIMFFGGLFFAFAIFRYLYPHAYMEGSRDMDVFLGTLNTGFLLTSSLTMALAVHAARMQKKGVMLMNLTFTLLFACGFIVIKSIEYHHKWMHGLVPVLNFTQVGEQANHLELFFFEYFCMTGLHGIHVAIGIGIIIYMMWKGSKGKYTNGNYMPVEILGLYWHFVDLVWIFLFPLFYLLDKTG